MEPIKRALCIGVTLFVMAHPALANDLQANEANLTDRAADKSLLSGGQAKFVLSKRLDDAFKLPDEIEKNLGTMLPDILQDFPRTKSAIVDLKDGRRLTIDREGNDLLVSPTGGIVAPLADGLQPPVVGGGEILRVVGDDGTTLYSTGPTTGVLGSDMRTCGTVFGDPNDHCALSTVRVVDKHIGLFCTGVVVSDRHVLTAAHCMCDKDPQNIRVRFGADILFHSLPIDEEVALFDGGMGTHCAAGQTPELSSNNGDLAVLTLHDPDPEDSVSPIDVVIDKINERAELAGLIVPQDELARMRSVIGSGTEEIWTPDPIEGNGFATWGWGDGPDGINGTKRGMLYPLAEMLPCLGDVNGSECTGLQEAIFHDRDHGLCAGDSGGGLFKAVEAEIGEIDGALAGYGRWALMGIVSGDIAPADCHNLSGELLATHHPRNVTRVDTPQVVEWLEAVTEDGIQRRPVRMTFGTVLVSNQ